MSYEGADRRDRDRDPVLTQLMALGKTVNDNHVATIRTLGDMSAALQVHVTEDKAVAEKVERHEKKWDDLDRLKTRGLIYVILGFVAAGGLGGTAAHVAKKFLE